MATGNIGKKTPMYGAYASGTLSIAAQASGTAQVNCASVVPNGYKIVAVNTITLSGTYSEYVVLRGFSISNSAKRISIDVRNLTQSSTVALTVNVWMLLAPDEDYVVIS